jgi:hypothetical protein
MDVLPLNSLGWSRYVHIILTPPVVADSSTSFKHSSASCRVFIDNINYLNLSRLEHSSTAVSRWAIRVTLSLSKLTDKGKMFTAKDVYLAQH